MKQILLIISLIFGVTAAIPNASFAQELRTIRQLENSSAKSYPFLRCGALNQAILERIGKKKLGEQSFKQFDEVRTTFFLVAAVIIQDEMGISIEQVGEITSRDGRNIANIYEVRMNNNFAQSGQAFGEDPVMQDDISYCKSLYEQIAAAMK